VNDKGVRQVPGASAAAQYAQEERQPAINDRAITRRDYFHGELSRDFHVLGLSLENAELNLDLDRDLIDAARAALSVAQSLLIKALA
jgi:hypothetical protein